MVSKGVLFWYSDWQCLITLHPKWYPLQCTTCDQGRWHPFLLWCSLSLMCKWVVRKLYCPLPTMASVWDNTPCGSPGTEGIIGGGGSSVEMCLFVFFYVKVIWLMSVCVHLGIWSGWRHWFSNTWDSVLCEGHALVELFTRALLICCSRWNLTSSVVSQSKPRIWNGKNVYLSP